MIKIVTPLRFAMAAGVLASVAPFASALSGSAMADCRTQAKTLKAQQASAAKLKGERDALAEEVEAAGETWEAAEETRLFGAEEARKADEAKAAYEALKADLVTLETKLQAKVSDLNSGVAAYNQNCATD